MALGYEQHVEKGDRGWDMWCHVTGQPEMHCFVSQQWPTQELAEERLNQHVNEHMTGQLMPPTTDLLEGQ